MLLPPVPLGLGDGEEQILLNKKNYSLSLIQSVAASPKAVDLEVRHRTAGRIPTYNRTVANLTPVHLFRHKSAKQNSFMKLTTLHAFQRGESSLSNENVQKHKMISMYNLDVRLVKMNTFVATQHGDPDDHKCWKRFMRVRDRVNKATQTGTYDIIMTMITVFALYNDDIRYMSSNEKVDLVFYSLALACFFIFLIEIIVFCIIRNGYICSFFFWMDLISTLSMVLEIPWVLEAVQLSSLSGQTTIAKAGRASRVSSRVTKLIRVIRLIRFVRITKLYKYAQKSLDDRFKQLLAEIHSVKSFEEGGRMDTKTGHSIILPGSSKRDIQLPEETVKQLVGSKRGSVRIVIPPLAAKERRSLGIEIPARVVRNSFTNAPRSSKINDDIDMILSQGDQEDDDAGPQAKICSLEEHLSDRHLNAHQQEVSPPKLFSNASSSSKHSFDAVFDEDLLLHQEIHQHELPQETRVGRKLSDLTTKRSIMLMLSTILTYPLFQYDTYWTTTTFYDTAIRHLEQSYIQSSRQINNTDFTFVLEEVIHFHSTYSYDTLVGIDVCGQSVYSQKVNTWRVEDVTLNDYYDQQYGCNSEYIYATSYTSRIQSILNILRTTFVVIILIIGVIMFTQDSNDLVVVPIENMLGKVKRITKSPLEAAIIEEDEEVYQEEYQILDKVRVKRSNNEAKIKKHLVQNTYETFILEKLIIRTGALLAIGFGEAGSRIIAENMEQGDAVDPLMPGKKICAIFGFCDIRNFTNVTEILKEDVMIFVNEIANIVHSSVHQHHGSANKNIGDAFLLVWKLPENTVVFGNNDEMLVANQQVMHTMAELALFSFLRVMVNIQTSMKLTKYRRNPQILEILPNFNVKLGYGIHIGWAIEGAIGSSFKIDASYLSPNVNMASRLESATKQYGVNILVSGPFFAVLSPLVQSYLRMIDRVTVKGSVFPIDLYTFDIDLTKLYVKMEKERKQTSNKKVLRYVQRRKLALNFEKILKCQVKVASQYDNDEDLRKARTQYTNRFFAAYQQGMNYYLSGQWKRARTKFQVTLDMIDGCQDGPSKSLLEFMERFKFNSPIDWKGYRMLEEK